MPTMIHTMPLPKSWNGRPDPLVGTANGMMIETSHVTIRGLKIVGLPVVETPKARLIQRLYAISRLRRDQLFHSKARRAGRWTAIAMGSTGWSLRCWATSTDWPAHVVPPRRRRCRF
jgi:hypothetical protein